jgi:hypothetical protein
MISGLLLARQTQSITKNAGSACLRLGSDILGSVETNGRHAVYVSQLHTVIKLIEQAAKGIG